MCTHTRLVLNKYTRKMVRVSCGKCKACQQEKANRRANRIRNNVRDGELCLFVTLTYSNEFCPYVDRTELMLYHKDVSVWRDASARMLKDGTRRVYRCTKEIAYLHPEYDIEEFCPDKCKDLRKYPNKVGVLFYKDLQDFIKRLRINLSRHYGEEILFSYFACGEYGGSSQRPHFHLLLFIPSSHEDTFRRYIHSSWPYDSDGIKKRNVEVARDAASYVASYVNSGVAVSSFFKANCFRQKHSYSKNFGVALECFSLREILRRTDVGSLSYRVQTVRDGYKTVFDLPIPEYVINRYFPKFKGLAWSDVSSFPRLFECSRVRRFCPELRQLPFCEFPDTWFVDDVAVPHIKYYMQRFSLLEYCDSDAHEFWVRINNCIDLYIRETGRTRYDYIIDYQRVWTCYKSCLLKASYFGSDNLPITNFEDFYENGNELYFGVVHAPTLDGIDLFNITMDANSRNDIVYKANLLTELYDKKDKTKKVVNLCMSCQGLNV